MRLCLLSSLLLIGLCACKGDGAPATASSAGPADAAGTPAAAATDTVPAEASPEPVAGEAAPQAASTMLSAPSWMPQDWDPNAFRGDAYSSRDFTLHAELVEQLRQEMQLTTPFTLWAVANDTLIDERFEPVWVWWTALRSCTRGITMNDDLAGEFGDRARGKAALTTAREELKAFAASQPADITLHFMVQLGKWNDSTGNFPLATAVWHGATNIDAREVERHVDRFSPAGATVTMGSDREGNWNLSEVQASISDVSCVTPDGQKLYRFSRQSQWYAIFGDADRGMGGLVNYRSRASVPAPHMDRAQAAAFTQRNPDRKAMVSITFAPGDGGFVVGASRSAVRAVLKKAVVIDALDGTVLATRTY